MKARVIIGIILGLLIAQVSLACWYQQKGKIVEETSWRKCKADFGGMLFLSADPEKILHDWAKPNSVVPISHTGVFSKQESFTAFIVFSGCAPDESKNCDVSVTYKIYNPDDSVYGELPTAKLYTGQIYPKPYLNLGANHLTLTFKDSDLSGQYRIIAQVTDNNAQVTVNLEREFSMK
jgi:hypothetical protein